MFPSFRTVRSGQTVQTQIRLLLEEQSDQGLHCLQFCLHLLIALLLRYNHLFHLFRVITANVLESEFLGSLRYTVLTLFQVDPYGAHPDPYDKYPDPYRDPYDKRDPYDRDRVYDDRIRDPYRRPPVDDPFR